MAPSPEHVVLEFEVQRLRDELRQYDQELPCWTAEVGVGLIFTIDPLKHGIQPYSIIPKW